MINVIGLGYIGLPTALMMASHGVEVVGTDYNKELVATLNAGFLSSMATWCSRHGVRLILVTTPVMPSFRTNEDPAQRAENERRLNDLLSRHRNIEYYDFETDARFAPDDFYDADHLNNRGAQRLTGLLRDILERGQARQPEG